MNFPTAHRAKSHSTDRIGRPNGKVKRCTDAVGIVPNGITTIRLIGAILLEQSDERAIQRSRYRTLETVSPLCDAGPVSLPAVAA